MERAEGQGERRKLFLKVYVSGFIMFALLWLQALPLFLIDDVRQFIREKYFIIYIVIAAVVICVLFAVYALLVYYKKDKLIWQFIIFILVIEAAALFWGTICTCVDSKAVGISLGVAIASCLVVIFLAFVLPIPKTRIIAFMYAYLGVCLLALIVIVTSLFIENAILFVVAAAIMIAATALYLFAVTNSISKEGSDSPIFNICQPFSGTAPGIPTEPWLFGGFGIFCTLQIMYACVLLVYVYFTAVK